MSLSTEAADSSASLLVAERYLLARELGRGSSATVYTGTDTRFDRRVTVKVFDAALAGDPSLRARFQQQAAKAARLRHPHIAALLDAGFAALPGQAARPFVVTEPAGTLSLRSLLDRERRLPPYLAVKLVRQVATALSYAHQLGVIHADVKPENVILDETAAHARLVDFSLSFVSARTGVVTRETIARRAAYLAPEQVRGESVGPQADVYGLGVLLYEMVVGRVPFVGATPEATAGRRVYEHARPAGLFEPTIPAALETVIGKALEREPERRWPSVDEFDQALSRLAPAQLEPLRLKPPPDDRPSGWRAAPAALRSRWGPLGLTVPILAGVLAFWLALSFIAPLLTNTPRFGQFFRKSTVPDFAGMSVNDARSLARSSGLELTVIGERLSDRVPKDTIVQQSPVAGWQADPNQPLRVTVSAGVTVPDVRGRSLENARTILSELGWKIAQAERAPYAGYSSGTVALQHPPPGEIAAAPGELALVIAE